MVVCCVFVGGPAALSQNCRGEGFGGMGDKRDIGDNGGSMLDGNGRR